MDVGLFDPLRIRGAKLANRVGVSPMCMYSCADDGLATQFHEIHLGSRAAGGAALVFTEATAVSPEGRITDQDLGIWSASHVHGLGRVVEAIVNAGSIAGIQLSHAGRKAARTAPWKGYGSIPPSRWGAVMGPSSIAFKDGYATPSAMSRREIAAVVGQFHLAAKRACSAGFGVIEAHFAHGYLIHQFLSPLTNQRTDAYGGNHAGRSRLAVEIVDAIRQATGDDIALFTRLSVVDWVEGGISVEESIQTSKLLADAGADVIDCSSGALVAEEVVPESPLYHVGLARAVRESANVTTAVVGVIKRPHEAEDIVRSGAADLVLLGRAMLQNAYWARMAADSLGVENLIPVPLPYRRAVGRVPRLLASWDSDRS
ncbi:MAG: NADH:flavin oxidoreductase/NADH oxidase [Actinomycetota bacterium]